MYNTGYRAMLRDRLPLVVNIALKWNNSKVAWIEHVYKNFIAIYDSNKERDNACRIVLGIKKNHKQFNFHNTIDWDNLKSESTNRYETKSHWKFVENWVDWFSKMYAYMENTYINDITSGCDKNKAKLNLKHKYLDFLEDWEQEDMANLLISYFNL